MATHLSTSILVTPHATISEGTVSWDEIGKIVFCGPTAEADLQNGEHIALEGMIAAPGMVNIHTHGGNGIAFGLGNLEQELMAYSTWAAGNGTTHFVITITGPDSQFIKKTIEAYATLLEKEYPGAQPAGLHLEGPYLNPEKRGAFNPDWIASPSVDEMQTYLSAGKGWIKHVTLAPELDGADEVAKLLKKNGARAALGHSNTNYSTAKTALEGNYTHVTHTFNAQSSMHHRAPGVVGAILSSDTCTAELIADAEHVHPAAMKILIRCLGPERVVLVTDAMPGAGLPDGEYELLGQKALVRNGKATYPEGTLAGSTATMDSGLRTVHKLAGVNLADTLRMASINPARVIGIDGRCGELIRGKDANIVILGNDLQVSKTYRKGKLIYEV